ncbi:hypothetical protein BDZ88DRAFT_441563 [Geranomyces variabilis]|nr:hypothetical protein BDZ88DRAFT_441563 [Geranomyces variabilis]
MVTKILALSLSLGAAATCQALSIPATANSTLVSLVAASACPWPGHCAGDGCGYKTDCWGDAECQASKQRNTCVAPSCPWAGHCRGNYCQQKSDCWGEAICVSNMCVPTPTPCPGPGPCEWESCGPESPGFRSLMTGLADVRSQGFGGVATAEKFAELKRIYKTKIMSIEYSTKERDRHTDAEGYFFHKN